MPRIGRPAAGAGALHAGLFIAALATAPAVSAQPGETASPSLAEIAQQSGMPQVSGLKIVYLAPLGHPAEASNWKYIIAHQTEGSAGSTLALAQAQNKNPTKRGVMLWMETDGTVYWATPETVIPTHGDGANRNDNKYVDNAKTYHTVIKTNSIGVEFNGNFPDVRKPVTPAQMQAWLVLVRFLQERYGIPSGSIYAHNWIDYKDARYCEGCDLAEAARKQGYVPKSLVTTQHRG